MSITISAIGRSIGNPLPLEQAVVDDADRELISVLYKDGFKQFLRESRSVPEMAQAAIKMSLQKTSVRPSEIDALIFSTESFAALHPMGADHIGLAAAHAREFILRDIALRTGLVNAFPYAVWLSACANFSSVVSLAYSLVKAGQHANVMVVVSDKIDAGAKRVSLNGATIFSDAAVAFVVSNQRAGFEIENVALHFSSSVLESRLEENIRLRGKALITALQAFRKKIQGIPVLEEQRTFVSDNIHSVQLNLICNIMGIETRRLLLPLKSTGHAFSADCPLAMLEFTRTGQVGEQLGALNTGPWGVGLTLFRYLSDTPVL